MVYTPSTQRKRKEQQKPHECNQIPFTRSPHAQITASSFVHTTSFFTLSPLAVGAPDIPTM
jgi:hypothetical protein